MLTTLPLAWKNLTHDLRKLAVAVSGIAFAVLLMFQQRGFNDALFDSTVEIVRVIDCDIIAVHPARFALSNEIRFDRKSLDLISSSPDVAYVETLYIENVAARLRKSGFKARPIRVIGFNLDTDMFVDETNDIRSQKDRLREPNTAIMDRLSKSNYGFDLEAVPFLSSSGELSGKEIRIVGSFRSGRDFANDGNLLMSKENFVNYFRYRGSDPLSVVDLGVVKLTQGVDPVKARHAMQERLGQSVKVFTKKQFIEKEQLFWQHNTPIGSIFFIGMCMGFAVGVIICYQILANDISEHMREFATLKAMGYTNRYFFGLVIQQAVYLALLGFIPGLLVSIILFWFNSYATGLLMFMTFSRVALILLVTLAMCVISGLLALRKLLAADPASLF